MGIGVTEDHAAIAEAVRGWASRHAPISTARDAEHSSGKKLPPFWDDLRMQGLLGMHLDARVGGGDGDAADLAVAIEALGYGLVAGPFLPTVITSTLLAMAGADDVLPDLADGSVVGATSFGRGPLLGGGEADVFILDSGDGFTLATSSDVSVAPHGPLDTTRSLATVRPVGDGTRQLPELTPALVREVAVTLAAAEAAGIAAWCLDTAVAYAKVREQFGRPIGQFQAVKHACADMLVQVEMARAAAWDAARVVGDAEQRPLAAAVAGAVALDAAVECAKQCIQILGGIGFTWEHDAHLYLRRAVALRQLLGPTSSWRAQAAQLARDGRRRALRVDLDGTAARPALEAATDTRADVRAFIESLAELDDDERRRRIADSGYIAPHWPAPYGRDAGAVEQLVIDAEFRAANVQRPDLVIATWILPTLIAYGTAEQQKRFITPTLHGELTWCQLFSEPGAGSDLAALQTRATRAEAGWLLSGQKVWTSLAHRSDYGLCLARTDPDAPKHKGITCFVVDMRAEGVDIRPLREMTGNEMFNEVFFNDVFVPDECVVGEINDGWRAGRTTLTNERVAMSTGSTMGTGVEGVLNAVADNGDADALLLDRVGALVAEGQTLAVLGLRTTLRQLAGTSPGASASVRKLVAMGHAQDCFELALELLGPAGATVDGPAQAATYGFLQSRCLTIAGGTTEVQRNVIAERLLGLPRDP